MGFQRTVNQQPAPAVPGDFAGTNPRASVVAPPNGYVAAPNYPATFGGALRDALIVGRFAWFNYATGLAANYLTQNSLIGFVHREVQTIITDFLGEQRMGVQQGFPVTGCSQGDFWADFSASAPDAAGLSVYADPVTGIATAGAPGASVTIAITASLASTGVLTVTVTAGVLAVGQLVAGAGVPAGSFITAQLTGSAGSTGTYQLNQGATVGSEAMTAYGVQETRFKLATPVAGTVSFTGALAGSPGAQFTGVVSGNVLTVSALTGVLHQGDLVSGTGVVQVPLGSQLTGFPGSVGTYNFTHADVGSEAMTTTSTPNGILAASAVSGGSLAPGERIVGASIPAWALILGQISGTSGGAGNYQTNLFQLIGSEAMTATQGHLGKISTWQA